MSCAVAHTSRIHTYVLASTWASDSKWRNNGDQVISEWQISFILYIHRKILKRQNISIFNGGSVHSKSWYVCNLSIKCILALKCCYKEIKQQSNYPLRLLETPSGRQKTNTSVRTELRNTNKATLPFKAY